MQKFVLFLDLIDDAKLIEAYENHHDHIPNSITKSIKDSGIITMEIFRFENRLVMEIVAEESFSFEKKNKYG